MLACDFSQKLGWLIQLTSETVSQFFVCWGGGLYAGGGGGSCDLMTFVLPNTVFVWLENTKVFVCLIVTLRG